MGQYECVFAFLREGDTVNMDGDILGKMGRLEVDCWSAVRALLS